MKITKRQLRRIIRERIQYDIQFEWSPGGLAMHMVVDGQPVAQFSTQGEVRDLIAQLESLLAGPMRTSP